MDSAAARWPTHAEHHLHVNAKEPRFMTHATSFEEVFAFIVGIYYP